MARKKEIRWYYWGVEHSPGGWHIHVVPNGGERQRRQFERAYFGLYVIGPYESAGQLARAAKRMGLAEGAQER